MSSLDKYQIAAQAGTLQPCNCIGPQRGEPRCPCGMRNVIKRDGRWIQQEVDLGPAPPDKPMVIGHASTGGAR